MAGDLPRIRGLDLGLRERDLFLDLDFLTLDLERRGLLERLGLLVRERVRDRLYLLGSKTLAGELANATSNHHCPTGLRSCKWPSSKKLYDVSVLHTGSPCLTIAMFSL